MGDVKTARELYYEIIKMFFKGDFNCGDRFLTYAQAQQVYGLTKTTLGVAYRLLQKDGFIQTCGRNGTIVTFDRKNPEHMARIPFYHPGPEQKDFNTYTMPIAMLSSMLHAGLVRSSEAQIIAYVEEMKAVEYQIRSGNCSRQRCRSLLSDITAAMDNQYVDMLFSHFISKYIYFDLVTDFDDRRKQELNQALLEFCIALTQMLCRRNFSGVHSIVRRYYDVLYDMSALVFSKLDESIDDEQALYNQLLFRLCARIMWEKMKNGDPLPTTKELCREYGISKTTVNKAYGILAEMGIISRKARTGTKFVSGPGDPAAKAWFHETVDAQKKSLKDALEALGMLQLDICRYNEIVVDQRVISQMRAELEEQRGMFEGHGTAFIVPVVLTAPLIKTYPPGIMRKYYYFLMNIVIKLSFFIYKLDSRLEEDEEIYSKMCEAIGALERGSKEEFTELSLQALHLNTEFLMGELGEVRSKDA